MRFVIFVVFMAIIIGACSSEPGTPLSEQTLGEYMEDNIDISADVRTEDGLTQIVAVIGTNVCGINARGDGVCDDQKMICDTNGVRFCQSDCHDYFRNNDCLREWIQDEYNDGNEYDHNRYYCFADSGDLTAARGDCGIGSPGGGTVTGCTDDSDCPSNKPICGVGGTCVECRDDGHCTEHFDGTNACINNRCRECRDNSHCDEPQICSGWSRTCVDPPADDDENEDTNGEEPPADDNDWPPMTDDPPE